jgi:hypothetical protein
LAQNYSLLAGIDPVTVTGLLNQTPSTAVAEVPKVSDTYMRPMADAMREASEKMAELVAEVEPDENWQESVSA